MKRNLNFKNGSSFLVIVEKEKIHQAVWDPYIYRKNGQKECLGDYLAAEKLNKIFLPKEKMLFLPIEYRQIPSGEYLSFALETSDADHSMKCEAVKEQELLFGTMRAYLGNILVTPKAEWINARSPLLFPVKSEFIRIIPKDKLIYFWWAFLKTKDVLGNLPMGTGGTRPRLNIDSFFATPVKIPPITVREEIHEQLIECARLEWQEHTKRIKIIESLMTGLYEKNIK